MIAGCALLGLLLGLALILLTPLTYRARTSGFNDQSFLRSIVLTAAAVSNESADSYLANEVKILESETLARRGVTDHCSSKQDRRCGLNAWQ